MTRHRWIPMAVVLLPLVELALLMLLVQLTNFWVVFGIIVVTAVIGTWFLTREGRRRWEDLRHAVHSGQAPKADVADATLSFLGGLCLIMPGVLADLLGVALVIAPTRQLIRRRLGWKSARHVSPHRSGVIVEGHVVQPEDRDDATVIRGEIVP